MYRKNAKIPLFVQIVSVTANAVCPFPMAGLAQQAARQRAEFDKLQRQLEETHSTAGESMRSEYEKAREEQERRHAVSTTLN